MAKSVVTISNSLTNVRIADIPLFDVISNAVEVPFSQAHLVDKFVFKHSPPLLALFGIAFVFPILSQLNMLCLSTLH